jgi:hypothetical protein
METPHDAPKGQPPEPTNRSGFRASTYGHRWSEFDPTVGKTVWRRESQKKKRRRSSSASEIVATARQGRSRSPSPPPPPAASADPVRHSRDPKMEITFLLN